MDILFLAAMGLITAILLGLYHSVFNVFYFSPQGCITEVIIAGLISYGIVILGLGFILEHWKVILGILVVAVVGRVVLSR